MTNFRKPSFFIIGAPKCGTTALAKYLSNHRSIFFSNLKEPNYFATDFNSKMRPIKNINDYLSLFDRARSNQLCGEGSIWYLYSKDAMENIYKFNPNAKIIIMVRNPAEMIYSLHNQKINSKDEDILDFQKAWKLSWERERGNYIPKKCKEKTTLYYHKIANYVEQFKKVYKFFSEKQVKIIVYDEFMSDNLKVYQDVLEFLNIAYDGKTSFEKVNVSSKERLSFLGTIVKTPPKYLVKVAKYLNKKFGIDIYKIQKILIKLNTRYLKKKPLENKIHKLVNNHYKESIYELSDTLKNKKIKEWLSID